MLKVFLLAFLLGCSAFGQTLSVDVDPHSTQFGDYTFTFFDNKSLVTVEAPWLNPGVLVINNSAQDLILDTCRITLYNNDWETVTSDVDLNGTRVPALSSITVTEYYYGFPGVIATDMISGDVEVKAHGVNTGKFSAYTYFDLIY